MIPNTDSCGFFRAKNFPIVTVVVVVDVVVVSVKLLFQILFVLLLRSFSFVLVMVWLFCVNLMTTLLNNGKHAPENYF